MRIAVAGLWHETNTFSSVRADLAAFEALALVRGQEVLDEYQGSQATIAGFLDAAAELHFDVVPLIHARTGPIGPITSDAFERIMAEMVTGLREGGPWDGVLLANHGAAVADGFPDADLEIVSRVRAAIGAAVPIGVALDLHANLSQALVTTATVITVYQTNPHLDARLQGERCARLLWRVIKGEIEPEMALQIPPLVINITRQNTSESPMREILAAARQARSDHGLLGTFAVQGYPYADVPQMGMSFLAIADGSPAAARAGASQMADTAWHLRNELQANLSTIDEALADVAAASRGPVVLMDVGDNIPGGSSADSTVLLHAAREAGIRGLAQTLFDPAAAAECHAAGSGAELTLRVGAKTDELHGAPLDVEARVIALDHGQYEDQGPTHGGFRYFAEGARAVVETTDGFTLLLMSIRSGNLSLQQWRSIGVEPANFRAIVAKGVVSPRAAYDAIASKTLLVDTPGLTTADLSRLDYQYRRRPLFPFEPAAPKD